MTGDFNSVKTRLLDEPVFWIDPQQINQVANFTKGVYGEKGAFLTKSQFRAERDRLREKGHDPGDWDLTPRPFSKEPFFDVIFAWDNGSDYKQTRSWKGSVDKWGEEKAEVVFARWRKMYEDMKENGYRAKNAASPWNEYVLVYIGRTGELLFYQGRHRLTMAQHLGIESIPVKVGLRHTEWHNFRKAVQKYASTHNGQIYSPIKHPDFATFTTKWTDYRGDLILQYINPASHTVLDIGAHWGYFSELLAETGRFCIAIEKAQSMFYFLHMVSRMHGKAGFNVVNSGINQFLQDNGGRFDCVIALNIFHHFLKDVAGWNMLVDVAENLNCNEMFFQMANDKTLGKFGGGWKKTADVLALLSSKAGLKNQKEIGREHNRTIYHLTRR